MQFLNEMLRIIHVLTCIHTIFGVFIACLRHGSGKGVQNDAERTELRRLEYGEVFGSSEPLDNESIKTAVDMWCDNSTEAKIVYGDMSTWDTSRVTDMGHLFSDTSPHQSFHCSSIFNEDISSWDVSSVTTTKYMFHSASVFDQDIGEWDVSSVIDMEGMFFQASAFNTDIGGWDVSSVYTMDHMFKEALSFDQDIGRWDVSNVESMYGMFEFASAFNKNLGGWDVSFVTMMNSMFAQASNFDQHLCWNLNFFVTMTTVVAGTDNATVSGGPQYSEYDAVAHKCSCPASLPEVSTYGQYGLCYSANRGDGGNGGRVDDTKAALVAGIVTVVVVAMAMLAYLVWVNKDAFMRMYHPLNLTVNSSPSTDALVNRSVSTDALESTNDIIGASSVL